MRTCSPVAALCAAAVLWAGPLVTEASASSFNVSPTQVYLSGKDSSALLTLRNDSDQPLRFQLSAFAWDQQRSGEMALAPTSDVVFFPALLTLGPREERKIRVGRVVGAGDAERTYRLFVEELPSLEAINGNGGEVKLLTRMGIPIFVRPLRETVAATISTVEHVDGALTFTITNSGTVHIVPTSIVVRGLADGRPVFEGQLQSWYILAGGLRDLAYQLPRPDCTRATALQVEVAYGSSKIDRRLDVPAGACTQ
jgi:fimbrial chaperone protein